MEWIILGTFGVLFAAICLWTLVKDKPIKMAHVLLFALAGLILSAACLQPTEIKLDNTLISLNLKNDKTIRTKE